MWELLGECQLDVSLSCESSLIMRYQIIPRAMFDDKLACVFLVMALGVMFDLNRQPCKSIIVIQADKQSTRGERDCSYWEEHVCQQWDSSIPHQLLYKLYISVGLIS
jgi:hypothetical protein